MQRYENPGKGEQAGIYITEIRDGRPGCTNAAGRPDAW